MAFFKFRNKSDAPAAAPVQPESIERMRQRAKYRLVGATLLVLLGVVGFPLLFDQQARPIAVDTPIEIPDKNKVPPLALPVPAVSDAASAPAPVAASAPVSVLMTETAETPQKSLQVVDKNIASAPVHIASEAHQLIATETLKSGIKSASAPAVNKSTSKPMVPEKAKPLPETKTQSAPATPASAEASVDRFVVQVGAFADAGRAKEVRRKLEAAGLKTYTHVAQTKDGERTRVRVGPFAERAEADRSAEKIKKLKLSAVVLTL
jgi:DedD protein